MLLGIDVGQVGVVGLHEVKRGRCDDSRRIMERSVVRHVINARFDPASGNRETRRFAVDVDLFGLCFGIG